MLLNGQDSSQLILIFAKFRQMAQIEHLGSISAFWREAAPAEDLFDQILAK